MTKSAIRSDRSQYLRRQNYGMTTEMHDTFAYIFGERCNICCKPTEKLHLDHCHETGVIRGYLCQDCNLGLGRFRDDPEIMKLAIAYLGRQGFKPQFETKEERSQRKASHKAKLTVTEVREIKNSQDTAIRLGMKYGVSRETVNAIRQGRNWKWVR